MPIPKKPPPRPPQPAPRVPAPAPQPPGHPAPAPSEPSDTLAGGLSIILSDTIGPGEVELTPAGVSVWIPQDIPAGGYQIGGGEPAEPGPAHQALMAFTQRVMAGGDRNQAHKELLSTLEESDDPAAPALADLVRHLTKQV